LILLPALVWVGPPGFQLQQPVIELTQPEHYFADSLFGGNLASFP
jgi:hypothetical protein